MVNVRRHVLQNQLDTRLLHYIWQQNGFLQAGPCVAGFKNVAGHRKSVGSYSQSAVAQQGFALKFSCQYLVLLQARSLHKAEDCTTADIMPGGQAQKDPFLASLCSPYPALDS